MEEEKNKIVKERISNGKKQPSISVEVRNLSYRVKLPSKSSFCGIPLPSKKRPKFVVLNQLNFILKPGETTLLLGGPSSGKTSILNVLSMNLPKDVYKRGKISGNLTANGLPLNPSNWNRSVAYCVQEDVHYPLLTVQETLYFAASLQMPKGTSKEGIKDRVDAVLHVLGLTHCKDSIIGSEMVRGISGGEKRRVSIGIAWVKGPSVILLDEPTTGLDNTAALSVVNSLKAASEMGSTVMCSLLQPSWEIVQLFDNIMIVTGGKIAYHGSVPRVVEYFEAMGYNCPTTYSKAEFISEVVDHSKKFLDDENSAGILVHSSKEFVEHWKSSDMYKQIDEELKEKFPMKEMKYSHSIVEFIVDEEEKDVRSYPLSLWQQIWLLVKRESILYARNWINLVIVYTLCTLIALLLGAFFFRVGNENGEAEIKSSAIFFSILTPSFLVLADVPNLVEDRKIFSFQRKAKWFSSASYFVNKALWTLPVAVAETISFGIVLFWMLGLNTGDSTSRFWFFVLGMIVVSCCCRALGYGIISLLKSPTAASTGSGLLLCAFALFCGGLVVREAIPRGWIWMYWINPVSYMFQMIMVNEFAGQELHCTEEELVPPLSDPRLPLPYSEGGFGGVRVCPYLDGSEFLEKRYGIRGDLNMRWAWLGVLIGLQMISLVIWFIAIKYVYFEHRKGSNQKKEVLGIETQVSKTRIEMNETEGLPRETKENGALLTWRGLNYSVGKKVLLDEISGYVKPGMILSLMGASGAGKSTLLDVLACRKNTGKVLGEILMNGKPIDKFFQRSIGYVEQFDVLWPEATVRETVEFSSRLRSEMKEKEKQENVDWVLNLLELTSISHLPVAVLSMEQRKRVSIAIEMVNKPKILFLDEPTSGLDSDSADSVVKAIQNLSATGISVICTIHQPSSRIFFRFTHLLLLKKGGKMVYFGELGNNCEKVLGYFRQRQFPCPDFVNPAAFIVDSSNSKENENLGVFDTEIMNSNVEKMLQTALENSNNDSLHSNFAVPWWFQFKVISQRFLVGLKRNPHELLLHLLRSVFIAILAGTAIPVDLDGQGTGRLTLLFLTMLYADITCFSMMPIVHSQRSLFYREKAGGFYHSTAFSSAQILCYMLPLQVPGFLLFSIIVYWVAGFTATAGSFFFFVFVVFGIGLSSIQLGNLLVTCFESIDIAGIFYTLIFVTFELSAGYLIPYTKMKPYVKWTYWISLFHYAMDALVSNEISGKSLRCGGKDAVAVPIDGANFQNYCHFENGDQLLEYIGYSNDHKWINASIIWASWLLFNIAIVLGMKFLNHQKR